MQDFPNLAWCIGPFGFHERDPQPCDKYGAHDRAWKQHERHDSLFPGSEYVARLRLLTFVNEAFVAAMFICVVPVVHRFDLLRTAVSSIKHFNSSLILVDNSPAGALYAERNDWPAPVWRVDGVSPLTFSQTMNLLRHWAIEKTCQFCLLMHNDAEAMPGTCERLLAAVDEVERIRLRNNV